MIRVTIRGAKELVQQLKDLPQRLHLAILKAMLDTAVQVQGLAQANAPQFRGMLRFSIVHSVREEGERLVGEVGSAIPYAKVVEYGRTPGWFPPVKDLKAWARRKLGDEHLSYVVGRAIKKRGYRAQPYLNPAAETVAPRVEMIFQKRISEAIRQAGGQSA
jgi:hypothetical protein